MSTLELKHTIVEYIAQIEDVAFLKALKTIIESKAATNVYKLSEYQKTRIELGREQLKNGQTISHELLQKEIDKWLATK